MEQLSAVAPLTFIVVTRVKPVVHMRVDFGQTVELSTGVLCFLSFLWLLPGNQAIPSTSSVQEVSIRVSHVRFFFAFTSTAEINEKEIGFLSTAITFELRRFCEFAYPIAKLRNCLPCFIVILYHKSGTAFKHCVQNILFKTF